MQPTAPVPVPAGPPATPITAAQHAQVDAALAASTAAGTRRNYAAAWQAWEAWCAEHGHTTLPANPVHVAAYLAELADRLAVGTVQGHRSAIAAAHRAAGAANPCEHEGVRKVLRGIGRQRTVPGRGQVPAVDWRDADRAAELAAADGTLAGLRDAALLAVMSDGLLRVSEAVALDCADVIPLPEGGAVAIRRSKTDQEGHGATVFVGPATMARLAAYRAAGGHDGPLFRALRRGGHQQDHAISVRAIRAIIRERCAAIGLENASGHSLRVGGAQSLAAAGCGLVEMQQAGRWESPSMPAHYARAQLAARGAVAKLRYGVTS